MTEQQVQFVEYAWSPWGLVEVPADKRHLVMFDPPEWADTDDDQAEDWTEE